MRYVHSDDVATILTAVAAVITAATAFGSMLQGWRRRDPPTSDHDREPSDL